MPRGDKPKSAASRKRAVGALEEAMKKGGRPGVESADSAAEGRADPFDGPPRCEPVAPLGGKGPDDGDLEAIRADRDRLLEQQRRIALLLKSGDPDKIVHDLRNLLNELQLYKMLAEATKS